RPRPPTRSSHHTRAGRYPPQHLTVNAGALPRTSAASGGILRIGLPGGWSPSGPGVASLGNGPLFRLGARRFGWRLPSARSSGRRRFELRALELDDEGRARARLGADVQSAAHPPHELARDIEAEARAARGASELRVAAVELLEDPLLLDGCEPGAAVAD